VYYIKDHPIQFLEIKKPTHWVIADTGDKTSTRETVSDVRTLHQSNPTLYDDIFKRIGEIAQQGRDALVKGELAVLGDLVNQNQTLLEKLEVSSNQINHLVQAARSAGAAGAKLSGGGRGGNIIALVTPENQAQVEEALIQAGAVRTITTLLPGISKNE
jgi:mevalonate kinase